MSAKAFAVVLAFCMFFNVACGIFPAKAQRRTATSTGASEATAIVPAGPVTVTNELTCGPEDLQGIITLTLPQSIEIRRVQFWYQYEYSATIPVWINAVSDTVTWDTPLPPVGKLEKGTYQYNYVGHPRLFGPGISRLRSNILITSGNILQAQSTVVDCGAQFVETTPTPERSVQLAPLHDPTAAPVVVPPTAVPPPPPTATRAPTATRTAVPTQIPTATPEPPAAPATSGDEGMPQTQDQGTEGEGEVVAAMPTEEPTPEPTQTPPPAPVPTSVPTATATFTPTAVPTYTPLSEQDIRLPNGSFAICERTLPTHTWRIVDSGENDQYWNVDIRSYWKDRKTGEADAVKAPKSFWEFRDNFGQVQEACSTLAKYAPQASS